MLHLKKKDFARRLYYKNIELKLLLKKFLLQNLLNKKDLTLNQRRLIIYKWSLIFNKNVVKKTQIHSRCLLTNRGRGVFKKFHLSRVILRELFLFGIVPGYKKAVW